MSSPSSRLLTLAWQALALPIPAEHPLVATLQPVLVRVRQSLEGGTPSLEAVADLLAVQIELGRAAAAEPLAEAALACWPQAARLCYLQGRIQRALGNLALAIQAYGRATKLAPELVDAWVSLGLALKQAGELSHAQDALIEANRLAPARADIFLNLGHLAAARLAWPGAEEAYRCALSLAPGLASATLGLARALIKLNRYPEAQEHLAGLPPGVAAGFLALRLRARTLYLAGDESGSRAALLAAFEAGLREGVSTQDLYLELVQDCEYPDACAPLLAQVLARNPNIPALQRLYVDGLIRALRLDEAERLLGLPESLETLDPLFIDSVKWLGDMSPKHALCTALFDVLAERCTAQEQLGARLEIGYIAYKLGRYQEAAQWHLRRGKSSDASFRGAGHERPVLWRGEPLAGKHLVVWREQGMGDTLQMLRFLPQLRALGPARLSYLASPELARLLALCPEVDQVIAVPSEGAQADYHLPDMNCLAHFVTCEADIPKRVPYLHLPPDRIQYWRERLGPPDGRLWVAITWAGNPNLDLDRARSVPTAQLAPLAALTGVRWLAIQKGPLRAATEGPLPFAAEDYSSELSDLVETGALLSCVDRVVSVDTAVAHLAGALGRPVYVLNRSTSEYRWQLGRDDSPWYPSLRLFNQRTPFDWSETLQALVAALATEVAGHPRAVRTGPDSCQPHASAPS